MSGPLAPLFAQVREELNRCAFGTESTSGLGNALAALSSIERHVQDMERALDELRQQIEQERDEWKDSGRNKDGRLVAAAMDSAYGSVLRMIDDYTALSAPAELRSPLAEEDA